MAESFLPLRALPEVQRAQGLECFTIIRPVLEEGSSQAPLAYIHTMTKEVVKTAREDLMVGRA